MRRLFRFTGPLPNLPPRYNVAPTQQVPIVRRARDDGDRELAQVRWGLIPFWAKDEKIGYKLINARRGHRRQAVIPRGVQAWAPVPDPRRRLLRVGDGDEAEAALARHAQSRRAFRLRRPLGALGEGAGRGAGRELHHLTTAANHLLRPLHGRYVTFQLAEVAVSRQMFQDILRLIARLRAPPAAA